MQFNDGQFPRKALEEAVANQEAITPRLLEILEHAEQNIREIAEWAKEIKRKKREKSERKRARRKTDSQGWESGNLTGHST